MIQGPADKRENIVQTRAGQLHETFCLKLTLTAGVGLLLNTIAPVFENFSCNNYSHHSIF